MGVDQKKLSLIIFFALIVRLVLAFFPSFTVDMNNWIAWSGMLAEAGPRGFYLLPGWTDYTPGFLYYLWILGVINKSLYFNAWLYPFLIKLPVVLADIGIGILLYKVLLKRRPKLATFAFFAYILNPVVVFANSIWGQTDGLIALFLLLAAYFLAEKKNVLFSALFWVLALLVKPQALFSLPVLLTYLWLKFKPKQAALFVVTAVFSVFILGLPFFIDKNPILGLPALILKMSNESPFTSVMAFNFWALVKGMWIPDSGTFLGISYLSWGAVLFVSAICLVINKLVKSERKPQHLYFSLGLTYLAFSLFSTRVHERYILVSLPFFLLSAGLIYSKFELALYFVVSALALINIYHPYAYYTPESFLSSPGLLEATTSSYKFFSLLFVLIFFAYFFKERISKQFNFDFKFAAILKRKPKLNFSFPKHHLSEKKVKYLLIAILAFTLITRVGWLQNPKNEYFDEVYHAFTARQILNGNPKAWEWWNTPPEGFAYEWTHPPLAKLGMVLGMKIFGENSFGWRIPGALLGVGSVLLVYLIAKKIFRDELLGILSAGVFSLDGLPLIMSRIGMNDSYLLFFVLLCLYLFLTDKLFLSAIAFGLAISSKWSGVWVLPILFVSHFVFKKKIKINYLWFLILPVVVYLATYAPMFLTGHGIDIFWGMQKQMWWYHTQLKATHPYTSSWWSWPFLARPIYLYTSNEVGGAVSRIYAMGNPIVFWGGLASIIVSFVYTLKFRIKKLALIIFSYLVFFVPWAASPRIMFLYHYLPSIPFLAMALGYILRRNLKLIVPAVTIALLLFLYFYPHWAGLNIPLVLDTSYYWFSSWR